MPVDQCCILASELALHRADSVWQSMNGSDDVDRRQSAEVGELTGRRCSGVGRRRRIIGRGANTRLVVKEPMCLLGAYGHRHRSTATTHQSADRAPQLTWVRTFRVNLHPPERVTLFLGESTVLTAPRVPRFSRCSLSCNVVWIVPTDSTCLALEEPNTAFSNTAVIVKPWIRDPAAKSRVSLLLELTDRESSSARRRTVAPSVSRK